MSLDNLDLKILMLLQHNARIKISEIARENIIGTDMENTRDGIG